MVNEHSGEASRLEINRGDVYWIQLKTGGESTTDVRPHPYVIVQENVLNHSRLDSVVVCALTSNLKRASWPGNVLLEPGEADLPRQSVVEVSKVASVKKAHLGEFIGSLSSKRIDQILAGMRLLQSSHYFRQAG